MKRRTDAQIQQDKNKSQTSGKFETSPKCEACGKPAGHDYLSDERCNEWGLGVTLCGRKRCVAKREALSDIDRRALYEKNWKERADRT